MIKMTKDTVLRVLRVYKKCLDLDVEHPGCDLSKKFEDALAYAASYADHEEKGESNIVFSPEYTDPQDGVLQPKHFHFWCSLRRGSASESFGMMMHFHNGGTPEFGEPVELAPEVGPHWSFHS